MPLLFLTYRLTALPSHGGAPLRFAFASQFTSLLRLGDAGLSAAMPLSFRSYAVLNASLPLQTCAVPHLAVALPTGSVRRKAEPSRVTSEHCYPLPLRIVSLRSQFQHGGRHRSVLHVFPECLFLIQKPRHIIGAVICREIIGSDGRISVQSRQQSE
jgi:hypothetical protein